MEPSWSLGSRRFSIRADCSILDADVMATGLVGAQFKVVALNDPILSAGCGAYQWSRLGIHEFPDDIFNNEERLDGAVALHVLCAMYMFYALALVCDDYFVPSLEKICERLHLSEDVAGATFMAAGSSAPELFTSVIGVFITKGDVGVGTIVGSAVFNILCIIGVCGIFAGQAVRLSCWTLMRDSTYYTISVATLIVVSGGLNKLKWLLAWPLSLLLFLTVPNCATPRWERWYMVTFVTSTLWIASFSYIMVWMVTVIGYTMGIPDVIMGITFLAAGTSVPDCLASLIVARQGMGDMAVSNSIGSNVFDILIGLGLPWTIKTLAISYGSTIHLSSKGLIFSVGLLLASVFLTVVSVHLNKWKLDRRLGFFCLLMYAVFLCFSILIEFNVFTFVNLPTCREE
ncbi:putative sodium/potassium/calcium exchanger 3-like [Triplophysa rosa]|uniref:Sodium/potassium/calcium exchanger 3-like n=1 Tax=Triplophysa rosa TaxID=992332 RepID=A0A9W8C0Y7_TRIRA|nr:putative sodium/potassium/calcium exchanger 3-like [Triplophysa rosa]